MKQMRFAIGQKHSAAARMSLRLRWPGWAIQPMRYSMRFTDIGHTGHSERQKYRDGDEEDRTSKRESLASAPALGERCHRSARQWRNEDQTDYHLASTRRPASVIHT